jgi:predicted nucleic acid-binding protein
MVLVDTSIWIDHFRVSNEALKLLLTNDSVVVHPLVIGELACGNLQNRQVTLGILDSLPKTLVASDREAYQMIESQRLFGLGLGFLDVHLLSACRLSGCQIWTKDKALYNAAEKMVLAFKVR